MSRLSRLAPSRTAPFLAAGLALAIVAIEPAAAQEFTGPEQITTFLRSFFEWLFTVGVLAGGGTCIIALIATIWFPGFSSMAKRAGGIAVGSYAVFLILNTALTVFGFAALDFAPV